MEKVYLWFKNVLTPFFLSYDGCFKRWQYFVGLLTINILSILFSKTSAYIEFVWTGLYFYMLFGFIQKRSRDLNSNALKFIVPIFLANIANDIKFLIPDDCVGIIMVLVGITLYAVVANLYLLFHVEIAEKKQVYEIKHPVRFAIILYILYCVVCIVVGGIIAYLEQTQKVSVPTNQYTRSVLFK